MLINSSKLTSQNHTRKKYMSTKLILFKSPFSRKLKKVLFLFKYSFFRKPYHNMSHVLTKSLPPLRYYLVLNKLIDYKNH